MPGSKETITLDLAVDPLAATVLRTADGLAFDLSGLPRLDPVLVGRKAHDVPDIVKRLCGICPVAHHLAGVAALENLIGAGPLPPGAAATRELLAQAAAVEQLAFHLAHTDRPLFADTLQAAKEALRAAGCPGHFPDVAIPGGVRATPAPAGLIHLRGTFTALAGRLAALLEDLPPTRWEDTFPGVNASLVNDAGEPAALGCTVRISDTRGNLLAEFPVAQWAQQVAEQHPGSSAPRPLITLSGVPTPYRVGPIARHPEQAHAKGPAGAVAAALLHAAHAIINLCSDARLAPAASTPPTPPPTQSAQHEGIGLIDSPRGLLMHRYQATADGTLTGCQILTPTAQNEPWLAHMLTAADATGGSLEAAIRAADPCLPCTHAPQGAMSITIADPTPPSGGGDESR